jgi:HSP20 family protein
MLPAFRTASEMAPVAARPINRLDSLFDRVFGSDGGVPAQEWCGASLSMWEDDDQVGIEVELPGVADKDLEITLDDGKLFIRGERKPEEGRRYLYNGRWYSRFERVITLPSAVKTEGAEAALRDGVLHVRLPKSPEAKPKKIAVRRT